MNPMSIKAIDRLLKCRDVIVVDLRLLCMQRPVTALRAKRPNIGEGHLSFVIYRVLYRAPFGP